MCNTKNNLNNNFVKPLIAIDLSRISFHKTGIEYFAQELTRVLIQDKSVNFLLVSNKPSYIEGLLSSSMTHVNCLIIRSDNNNFQWMRKVAKRLKQEKVNLLISPSNLGFSLIFRPTYQIVHDLSPMLFPRQFGWKPAIKFTVFFFLATFFSKKLLCNSNYTQRCVRKYFPWTFRKLFVIGGGINEWTDRLVTDDELQKNKTEMKLPDKYLLSVSTLQPRKNYENMIKAFYQFNKENSNYKYLIVGKKGWKYQSIFDLVKELQLEDKVIFLDYVEESKLITIYKGASAFLYCSLFEGLGLPAVEAYKIGVPVVVSDIPVMRETMENKAIYANPRDVGDISKAISLAINLKSEIDPQFLAERSWEKVGKRVISLIVN